MVQAPVEPRAEEQVDRQRVLAALRKAPVGFATQVLGVQPRPHQVRILNSVRDRRRTLAISCNSIGKDFIAAVATHWWLQVHEEALVITTAPTGEQVRNIQWKEIRHMWLNSRIPLGGEIPEVEPVYRLGSKRKAFGLATRDEAERLQGHHEAHILIIITEGSAVSREAFDGVRALMASGDVRVLVLTNPTRNDGEVWDICNSPARSPWNIIQVSGLELPNMRACREMGEEHLALSALELETRNECPNPSPFLLTHLFEAETREDFGEHSDYYKIHVLGEFGSAGADQLIPREWVEMAFERDPEFDQRPCAGLDIARSGRDKTAYVEMNGNAVTSCEEWFRQEVTQTEGRIRNILGDPATGSKRGMPVAVDDTGLGGGVAPHLAEDYKRVFGVDFASGAEAKERFANKPSEMAFRLRQRLDPDSEKPLSLALVPQAIRNRLILHLTKPTFSTEDSKGRLKIDKRGGGLESPDLFDAFCLALEARQQFLWSGLSIGLEPATLEQLKELSEDEESRRGMATFADLKVRVF